MPLSIESWISRHRQLNAWRMELTTVQETFSYKTKFFKIDQLIADNPKSTKETFNLFHITITSIATRWGGSQIKSIADQDCSAPYVGVDFTEYQWLFGTMRKANVSSLQKCISYKIPMVH